MDGSTKNEDLPENHIVEWKQCVELSYETGDAPVPPPPVNVEKEEKEACFQCGETSKPLSKCAKCKIAKYCSRQCQIDHWKKGSSIENFNFISKLPHRYVCQAYRVTPSRRHCC